ncbi:MAG: phosphohydrolase [Alphaproteobacteria bacterium]
MNGSKQERPGLSPLGEPHWVRAAAGAMSAIGHAEWLALDRQQSVSLAREKPRVVLALFEALGGEPSFGYEINMQRHGLQAATFAFRDGRDEETVVVALLHDIGFTLAHDTHAAFAAMVLGPHISEANRWMLLHHPVFLDHHVHGHPGVDRMARERWRGHPHFEWTATFVERYDQAAVSAAREILPLEAFIPMVHRFFAEPRRDIPAPVGDGARTEYR